MSLYTQSNGFYDATTTGAQGYFDYFNGVGNQTGPAGDRTKGYYSYNVGAWHLIVLNTDCSLAGGCNSGSPQDTWLRADLSANAGKCLMAYSHFPMFSSGQQPHNSGVNTLFQDLYNAHGDIYLALWISGLLERLIAAEGGHGMPARSRKRAFDRMLERPVVLGVASRCVTSS